MGDYLSVDLMAKPDVYKASVESELRAAVTHLRAQVLKLEEQSRRAVELRDGAETQAASFLRRAIDAEDACLAAMEWIDDRFVGAAAAGPGSIQVHAQLYAVVSRFK